MATQIFWRQDILERLWRICQKRGLSYEFLHLIKKFQTSFSFLASPFLLKKSRTIHFLEALRRKGGAYGSLIRRKWKDNITHLNVDY